MAIDLRQTLRMTQQILMTPQLQQAVKLLQLSRLELEEFVTTQMAENPTLEEGVVESPEETAQMEREVERTAEQANSDRMEAAGSIVDQAAPEERKEMDWEPFNQAADSTRTPSASAVRRESDEEMPNYENFVSKAATLNDHLLSQVGETDFDDNEKDIASMVIGNIDERGYLRIGTDELAQQAGVEVDFVEDVLDTIQRFDPPGVGARDLKECLLIQVRNGHLKNGIVERIIDLHLHELETRNYQAISKALKVSLDDVIDSVQIIAALEPIPGRQFGGDSVQIIIPDVYVFKLGNDWVVTLNEDGLPKLRLSNVYRDMLANKEARGQDKSYLQEKLKSASWLIKSIQQRQRTILKVSEHIVERQKEFFEHGVDKLKPMILRDIAEDVSMHESTISRVTSNKYMHTPRGIFELKYFFNSSVKRADGQDVASESVKRMIEDVVKVEDTKHPLSDQRIVEILEEKGIQLARRTVAKYREQLGILPSSKRKKYF